MFKVFNIVLYQPEIPANTGNIGRTCLITGSRLHLIKPLGFQIDDKSLKRAGMDYWSSIELYIYDSWSDFLEQHNDKELFFSTTKSKRKYTDIIYPEGAFLIFGPESRGIPLEILMEFEDRNITVPMKSHPLARSLNLSNTVSILLYEALRQSDFAGL